MGAKDVRSRTHRAIQGLRPQVCVAFSPHGRRIATACDDDVLRIWEAGA